MEDKALFEIQCYLKLRDEVNYKCDELHLAHQDFTQCKNGCDECCMDFNVFPVEFYAILQEIKENSFNPASVVDAGQKCIFLSNHSCLIYHHRPIICRSHGLPLLFMDQEGEEWQLSFCEKNFKDAPDDLFDFDNTYPQDKFNSSLYLVNKEFIAHYKDQAFSEHELIPLKKLLNYL